ncbi:hypothetical protein FH039_05550 [Thermococcus indicus]|uniref:Uncharacterized protein n=1 Tax=Thermococcus indicus TaxID=2586643 RepID=A0A4Y5SJU7_9EURY|nr:hypothetical protein [Thermococcus indicus]QDA31168.1 hypothetical protein FH039_05550 [Thermococcus indicus]
MITFSFFPQDGNRGFPVLVLGDGPVFISEDPVALDEFMSPLKALQSNDVPPKKLWDMEIRAEGGWVCLTLQGGREVQVTRKKLVETIRTSIQNLEAVLHNKPVRMEWLRFKLKPPSPEVLEMLGEPEDIMDEYEVQVYGSTYVLEAFVNLEGYVEELKLLKAFVADGKLPGERWRVKRNVDGEIKRLSSKGAKKPEDRGLLRELAGLKKLSAGAAPPFVRFTLSTYDPFEVLYAADSGKGEFLLAFVLYSGMAVKVPKDVLIRAIDEAIKDAEKELERVKLPGR